MLWLGLWGCRFRRGGRWWRVLVGMLMKCRWGLGSGDIVGIGKGEETRMESVLRSGDGGRGHDWGSASSSIGIGTGLGATIGRGRESEGTDIDTESNAMSDLGQRHGICQCTGRGAEIDEGRRTIGKRAGEATTRPPRVVVAMNGGDSSAVGADRGRHTKTGEGGAMIDDGMRVAC